MRISWQQLYRLPVQTESGQKIGIVQGVTIEVDSHSISLYEVKPATILAGLFSKPLLIAPQQVISISEQAMIVKDSIVGVKSETNSEKTRIASMSSVERNVQVTESE